VAGDLSAAMDLDDNRRAVDSADLDTLVRHVDALCATGSWELLDDLRHRCRAATERGHQLWPISSLAEYRLALRAPARWAGPVITGDTGVLALGPLAEVAASTHTFAELAPHLPVGPAASVVAHERVVRGEDLSAVADGGHLVADDGVPLVLCDWEPDYPLATYRDTSAEFAAPTPPLGWEPWQPTTGDSPAALRYDGACGALRELVAGWVGDQPVEASVVVVAGTASDAVHAVCPSAQRVARIDGADAMATMAWAAASGGPSGRRRGMARGRFDAWWAVAALAGLDDDWPVSPGALGDAVGELQWWVFDDPTSPAGWHLRLAVGDPADALAWAIDASVPCVVGGTAAGNDDTPPG
jgi:hypothetical protein